MRNGQGKKVRVIQKLFFWSTLSLAFLTARALTGIGFKTLISFDGTNGDRPCAGLTFAQDGNLYGTSHGGGEYRKGTIYKITPEGALTVLFSFDGTNGYAPLGELVQGKDGTLYGTTANGGNNYNSVYQFGLGTIFRINTNGLGFTNLHLFGGHDDGSELAGGLTFGSDGSLYGMTRIGGAHGLGTAFRISADRSFKTLLSLTTNTGALPDRGLTLARDGNLYGTMAFGGQPYGGTFFKLDTNGALKVLASFKETNITRLARNKLVQGADGAFYGTTEFGGPNNNAHVTEEDFGDGTIFKLTRNGIIKTLAYFNGTNGAHPESALIQGEDGCFYGTTKHGPLPFSGGTVFKVTTNGVLTTLHAFKGAHPAYSMTNGWAPFGLAQDSKGNFYGTTILGGEKAYLARYGWGTVFRFRIER